MCRIIARRPGLTFSGFCISNTFSGAYASTVFIKEFNSSYTVINSAVTTGTNGQPFSITLQTGGGTHIQYGFETIGPDADPTNMPNLGVAIYQVQVPAIEASALSGQAVVAGQNASFTETLTVTVMPHHQWQLNGAPLSRAAAISAVLPGIMPDDHQCDVHADAGTYTVGGNKQRRMRSASASAPLVGDSRPLPGGPNQLVVDPSFESDTFAPVSSVGWFSYWWHCIQRYRRGLFSIRPRPQILTSL